MKQNRRFIQQFPVEKNNQQNYTEIVNMTIFTNIFTAILYNCSATSCGRSRTSSIPMPSGRAPRSTIQNNNIYNKCTFALSAPSKQSQGKL